MINRIYFSLPVLTFFWDLVYKFLPNRGASGKTTLRKQLPGAFFTACGWIALSFIFSIYLDIFKGFTNMYGSFTTIILVMLWLYGCMYIYSSWRRDQCDPRGIQEQKVLTKRDAVLKQTGKFTQNMKSLLDLKSEDRAQQRPIFLQRERIIG